jgi:hypothetical protein
VINSIDCNAVQDPVGTDRAKKLPFRILYAWDNIQGCHYHLTSAVFKNVLEGGLRVSYSNNLIISKLNF